MIIDLILCGLILLAIMNGYRNGLIIAVFSVIALLVGLAAAIKLSAIAAGYLKQTVSISDRWLPVISFSLVFFLAAFIVRFVAKFLDKTARWAMLGWANKLGGILLFALLYLVIFSIVLFYGSKTQLLSRDLVSTSVSYKYIIPWGPKAMNALGELLPLFKGLFHDLEAFFEKVSVRKY
jgi:membrane protein required for colicin V production